MSSSKTFVDLSLYPDPGSDEFFLLPVNEQWWLEDYHTLTEEATAVPAGTKVISVACCMEVYRDGELCQGALEVVRLQMPSEIRWECLHCGRSGVITGFEKSTSDLSGLPEEEAQQYLDEKYGSPFGELEERDDDDFRNFDFDAMAAREDEFINWFINLQPEEKEELLAELDVDIDEINRRFETSTGGLDPGRLQDLLLSDWEDPGSSVVLSRNLRAGEVKNSLFFHNARTMLLKVQNAGRLELTPAGNLKRKHISELIEECVWPEGYIEKIMEYNKVINEENIWLLHIIRVLLDLGGLIRNVKGKLLPVKKRADLSLKSKKGELFRHLFITYFRSMRISYLSYSYMEYNIVQESIPFTLYRLQQLADDWISGEELAENALLVSAQFELESTIHYSFQTPGWILYNLVLRPLELFGLIESRHSEKPDHSYIPPDQFRKTPLFDKFITFRL